jgi:acetyl esterase/lipase
MVRFSIETPAPPTRRPEPVPAMARRLAYRQPRQWPLFLLAISILLFSGCSPSTVLNSLAPDDGIRLQEGERYGNEDRQLLDIYRPDTVLADSPVLVFFYGGSWRRGDRGDYRYVGYNLSANGYVTVIPDYRLYPQVRFPEFVEDGAQALAWVRDQVPEAGNGIVLIGHSAGAHIAALLALDDSYLRAASPDTRLIGMIGLAGPYAFDPLTYRRTRPIFNNLADPDQTRPITFACTDAPPLLLLHGRDDTIVVPENSIELQEKATGCGNRAELALIDDIGHIGILLALTKTFSHHAAVQPHIDRFLTSLSPRS